LKMKIFQTHLNFFHCFVMCNSPIHMCQTFKVHSVYFFTFSNSTIGYC
jgi:hypothetical protein